MKRTHTRWLALGLTGLGVLLCAGFKGIQLKDIESAVIQEDFETARRLARVFIDGSAPEREIDTARYYLGLSLLFEDSEQEARAILEPLAQKYPDGVLGDKARVGVIDSFILQGEYDAALNRAQDFLRAKPDSDFTSLIYLKLARSCLRLTRWAEARRYLEKIIAQFPDSPEAHRARQLLNEKQFFAVQVGSFLDRARAEKLAAKFKQEGEYAYVLETTDTAGRVFYRVRIGRFSRLSEARSQERRLSDLGYPTLIYP